MTESKLTPGAGVDPVRVIKPSKRVRNWHRKARVQLSLRSFVLSLAMNFTGQDGAIARRWLANKGARP